MKPNNYDSHTISDYDDVYNYRNLFLFIFSCRTMNRYNNEKQTVLKNESFDKAYISGKITGVEKYAKVEFNFAEKVLTAAGFNVINPFKLPADHDLSWSSYMRVCIKALCDCKHIYMLRNWKRSKGAIVEYLIARVLKIKVIYQ